MKGIGEVILNKEIGKRIEKIRLSMDLNKEQFAKLIDIPGQNLGLIERGETGISRDKLINVCIKTGVSADYILFGKIDNRNLTEKINSIFSTYSQKELKIALDIIDLLAKNKQH